MNNDNTNGSGFLIAFLTGVIAGGAAALALQSEEGKELVKSAKETAEKTYSEIKENVEEAEREIEERFKKAMDDIDVDELEQKGREKVEEVKERFNS